MVVDPAWALVERGPVDVLKGSADIVTVSVGLKFGREVFWETRAPPTAHPTTAPVMMVAATSMTALHFF